MQNLVFRKIQRDCPASWFPPCTGFKMRNFVASLLVPKGPFGAMTFSDVSYYLFLAATNIFRISFKCLSV